MAIFDRDTVSSHDADWFSNGIGGNQGAARPRPASRAIQYRSPRYTYRSTPVSSGRTAFWFILSFVGVLLSFLAGSAFLYIHTPNQAQQTHNSYKTPTSQTRAKQVYIVRYRDRYPSQQVRSRHKHRRSQPRKTIRIDPFPTHNHTKKILSDLKRLRELRSR